MEEVDDVKCGKVKNGKFQVPRKEWVRYGKTVGLLVQSSLTQCGDQWTTNHSRLIGQTVRTASFAFAVGFWAAAPKETKSGLWITKGLLFVCLPPPPPLIRPLFGCLIPQISSRGPLISPQKPPIRPLRLQISHLSLKISSLRLRINPHRPFCPLKPQISPHKP